MSETVWEGADGLRGSLVSIDGLEPSEGNPRRGDVAAIAASLRRFGQVKPVVVSGTRITAGHHLVLAASELGWSHVAVVDGGFADEDEQRAFLLADNRLSELGHFDEELLAQQLNALRSYEGVGYSEQDKADLDARLAALRRRDAEPDAVPPLPVEAKSRAGEVYELGPHRLMCGDATAAADVAKLLGGAEPLAMLTDPPYGVSLDSEWRDRAGVNSRGAAEPSYLRSGAGSSDIRADWSAAFELVPSLLVAYVWHASSHTCEVAEGLRRIGFEHFQQIIWDKGMAMRTRTHYWYQHEPCWYARKPRAPWYGAGGTANATVWTAAPPKFIFGGSHEERVDHPTQKPVLLYAKPIENHLRAGEGFYEPFAGSGTAIIAAEQASRVCYAMERSPAYCDVIRQRYADYVGAVA